MYCNHRDEPLITHSFPTLRSSDLRRLVGEHKHLRAHLCTQLEPDRTGNQVVVTAATAMLQQHAFAVVAADADAGLVHARIDQHHSRIEHDRTHRSEEHTSDIQSLMRSSYAVFFLKNKNTTHLS